MHYTFNIITKILDTVITVSKVFDNNTQHTNSRCIYAAGGKLIISDMMRENMGKKSLFQNKENKKYVLYGLLNGQ